MNKNKIIDNVRKLVKNNPHLADNYNMLISNYWRDIDKASNFDNVSHCTSAEGITRAFRKLVEQGVVSPSEEVKEKRSKLEVEYSNAYKK